MPRARKKEDEALNRAYVVASSSSFAQTLNTLKDALVGNGFERVEVESMIQARRPQAEQGDLGPLWAPPREERIEIQLTDEPTRATDLPDGVEYEAGTRTIRIPRALSLRERQRVYSALTGQDQQTVAQILHAATATPAERGETIAVPRLLLKQGDLFETFEQSHLMEVPWALSRTDVTLPSYAPVGPRGESGRIDIGKEGRIDIATGRGFLDTLHVEMSFFAQDLRWSDTDLVRWLDRQTATSDVTQSERERFLTRVVMDLTRERGFSLTDLIRDRFNLRRAVVHRIDEHRKAAGKQAFQLFLDGEGEGDLVVDPGVVFTFPTDAVYSQLYTGNIRFRKHYYRNVGHLNGEEEEFAALLDGLDEVDTWVRNPERQPRHSFWLQTSTDRFYPDFVCKLKDGRILVAEYKGADRYDHPEEVEKRILGELWAEKSEGKCVFVMVTDRKWETARTAISNMSLPT
jgi:type III restriction enzyme